MLLFYSQSLLQLHNQHQFLWAPVSLLGNCKLAKVYCPSSVLSHSRLLDRIFLEQATPLVENIYLIRKLINYNILTNLIWTVVLD